MAESVVLVTQPRAGRVSKRYKFMRRSAKGFRQSMSTPGASCSATATAVRSLPVRGG